MPPVLHQDSSSSTACMAVDAWDEPWQSSQTLQAYPERAAGPGEVCPSLEITDKFPAFSSAICPGFS